MRYRRLGSSGLQVSTICLGTMNIGDRTYEASARAIIARGEDAGVNFADTADQYAAGRSEEIVGLAIKSTRRPPAITIRTTLSGVECH